MPTVDIKTGTIPYKVYVGKGLLSKCSEYVSTSYSAVWIITDTTVADLYLEQVSASLSKLSYPVHQTIVPAGEGSKSFEVYYKLQSEAIDLGLDRRSLIIALGGGVIGDLAGFVAATFMRGIDFIQIPTTILAHDSSVGGKVGINHEKGKNLIGSFHQPSAVIYDVETLLSLPAQEVRSGYAEVVKHGLIEDVELFTQLMDSFSLSTLPPEELEQHLVKGIKVKAAVVEKDEKEKDIRKFLNFGHTLGHAIEAELGYGTITHGEAVAVGMLFAIRVSEEKLKSELPYESLKDWLMKNEYPLQFDDISIANLISRMKRDKKAEKGIIQMVLLEKVEKPVVIELDDKEVMQSAENFFKELRNK